MRRSDIVFGILIILSIIDFTLAAPVPMQEKHQTCADVAHISDDVTVVLGKRSGELEKAIEDIFGAGEKPVESSDAQASSSSVPPGTKHGPLNDLNAPAPNPPSLPAHLVPLMGPSSSSPIAYLIPGEEGDAPATESDIEWLHEEIDSDTDTSSSSFESIVRPTSAHDGLMEEYVPQPITNSKQLKGPDPNKEMDWDFWSKYQSPPRPTLVWPKESGQAHENQVEYVLQPNLGPSTDLEGDYRANLEDQPPPKRPKLASSEESSRVHEDQVQQPNAGLSATLDDPPLSRPASPEEIGLALPLRLADGHPMMAAHPPSPSTPSQTEVNSYTPPEPVVEPLSPHEKLPTVPKNGVESPPQPEPKPFVDDWPYEEVARGRPSSPAWYSDLNSHPSHQSFPVSTENYLAAIYAVKDKSMEYSHIPDTARDVGKADQRELQPGYRRSQ